MISSCSIVAALGPREVKADHCFFLLGAHLDAKAPEQPGRGEGLFLDRAQATDASATLTRAAWQLLSAKRYTRSSQRRSVSYQVLCATLVAFTDPTFLLFHPGREVIKSRFGSKGKKGVSRLSGRDNFCFCPFCAVFTLFLFPFRSSLFKKTHPPRVQKGRWQSFKAGRPNSYQSCPADSLQSPPRPAARPW